MFKEFYNEPLIIDKNNSKSIIAEIAGKDSIAAVIQYVENNSVNSVLGVALFHNSIYGNINEPLNHFKYLLNLHLSINSKNVKLIYLDIGYFFEHLIIKNMAIIQKYFGYFNPCPACHLLFHMIRIPIAKYYNINKIITGEREYHGIIQKLNQFPEFLDIFKVMLEKNGIELIQPLRKIIQDDKVYHLLGNSWEFKIAPSKCIFSKSYYDENREIPFDTEKILLSLETFFYPLFKQVIDYIILQHQKPSENWINEKIFALIKKK